MDPIHTLTGLKKSTRYSRISTFITSIVASILILFSLLSCVPQQTAATPLDLHDLYFYDSSGGIRYSLFYGEPRTLNTNNQRLQLTTSLTSDATSVPQLSFPEALYVNNFPYIETALEQRSPSPFAANRSRFTSDINFTASEAMSEVIYYDGFFWFTLATDVTENIDAVFTPKRRFQKLQGFGQLTNSEAQALSDYYESLEDPLLIGLLPVPELPEGTPTNPRANGFENYRETYVYIQRGLPLNDDLVSTAVNGVRWELLASGEEESVDRLGIVYEIATTDSEFTSMWNIAHAKSLNPPVKPRLNLERESILGVFLSSRSDTNYNFEIVDAVEESDEIYLDVKLNENTLEQPLLDTTTSSSETIYNPWTLIRILRADVPVVWIRDVNSGDLLGVARQ